MVAAVQPGWIEGAAGPLLRREYSDPHWVSSRGQVSAYESVSLCTACRWPAAAASATGRLRPPAAHEIFIQEALVAGRSSIAAPFVAANRELKAQVEGWRRASAAATSWWMRRRRRSSMRRAFRMQVNSVAGFESWWREHRPHAILKPCI